jgi:hypothetical protein
MTPEHFARTEGVQRGYHYPPYVGVLSEVLTRD